jgi:hypothetical protein
VFVLYQSDPFREADPADMTTSAVDTIDSARDYAADVLATLGVP